MEDNNKTAEEIVEENFKGLTELIRDEDLLIWYKSLIVTCMEEYASQKDIGLKEGVIILTDNDVTKYCKEKDLPSQCDNFSRHGLIDFAMKEISSLLLEKEHEILFKDEKIEKLESTIAQLKENNLLLSKQKEKEIVELNKKLSQYSKLALEGVQKVAELRNKLNSWEGDREDSAYTAIEPNQMSKSFTIEQAKDEVARRYEREDYKRYDNWSQFLSDHIKDEDFNFVDKLINEAILLFHSKQKRG